MDDDHRFERVVGLNDEPVLDVDERHRAGGVRGGVALGGDRHHEPRIRSPHRVENRRLTPVLAGYRPLDDDARTTLLEGHHRLTSEGCFLWTFGRRVGNRDRRVRPSGRRPSGSARGLGRRRGARGPSRGCGGRALRRGPRRGFRVGRDSGGAVGSSGGFGFDDGSSNGFLVGRRDTCLARVGFGPGRTLGSLVGRAALTATETAAGDDADGRREDLTTVHVGPLPCENMGLVALVGAATVTGLTRTGVGRVESWLGSGLSYWPAEPVTGVQISARTLTRCARSRPGVPHARWRSRGTPPRRLRDHDAMSVGVACTARRIQHRDLSREYEMTERTIVTYITLATKWIAVLGFSHEYLKRSPRACSWFPLLGYGSSQIYFCAN